MKLAGKMMTFAISVFSLASFSTPPVTHAATGGSRVITFKNNCSYPVWFGIAGGSAGSKLSGTTCNSNSDCYPGSSCIQTGPIKQCFWNNPQPSNGTYQLAPNG